VADKTDYKDKKRRAGVTSAFEYYDKKEDLEYLRQPGLVGDIEKVHPAPVRPVYSHNLNIQTSEEERKKEEAGEICAGIFKQSMEARNREGIGLLYRPARLHRLAESILGLLKFKNSGSVEKCKKKAEKGGGESR
jgi:hypothetical protein